MYSCYDLLSPDVVMELAWLNGMMDCAMPFMIQFMREYSHKVNVLENDKKTREAEKTSQEAEVKQVRTSSNI